MSDFFQDGPRLGNQWDDDPLLRGHVRWRLGAGALADVEPGLRRLGGRVVADLARLGDRAEAEPPRHVPYDAWGRRVDEIAVSDAWRALDRAAAEEGIVATAYERAHGPLSRVHQAARLYLYHPATATHSCPLAMADGAARFLELHGDERTREAFERLTTRDPARAWTSGQWMTERTGGSDVARTSTVARRGEGGAWTLHGTKWFTSATTSQMAIALARPEGAPAGGRGLSVFLVELRDAEGRLRGIRVNRLKDKLGTHALPTAELALDGTPALLVGGEGDGVRKIASLFNVTRVYNAVCAAGGMRRAVALAADYAARRVAFGKPLREHPLHAETLADMETRWRACAALAFHVAELVGRDECGAASEADAAVLRLLTPVAKLYTARQAVAVASEALECFGGAGYVEDTGLPRLLRDAQVLPIWEGTTNVLSLDVWRAIDRAGALAPWLEHLRGAMRTARGAALADAADCVLAAAEQIERFVAEAADAATREAGARRLAFAVARTAAASRLVEYADWCVGAGDPDAAAAVRAAARWTARGPAAGLEGARVPESSFDGD
jgi:alkylation response protein AidB-like acyl-CoA dehydrogenase